MKYKFCTCAFNKCRDYGLNPQMHNHLCPLYKPRKSIYKDEWLNPDDEEIFKVHVSNIKIASKIGLKKYEKKIKRSQSNI